MKTKSKKSSKSSGKQIPVCSVIMAGGIGERFWPYSRKSRPKQMLKLFGKKPMIKETADRLKPLVSPSRIYVSTGAKLAGQIKKVLPKAGYVVEPMGKNTAACIGLSMIQIMKEVGDAVVFIETADHVYGNTKKDTANYLNHIKEGISAALDDRITLIGIKPTSPHTGYGYIQKGSKIKTKGKIGLFNVKSFKEKPNLKTAEKYVKTKQYLWNSGMFISKASVMLDEIGEHMPKLHNALMKILKANFSKKVLTDEFKKLESISIDYGIMEKSKRVSVLEATMKWDDIGDWNAVSRHFKKDKEGNVIRGNHVGLDTENSVVLGGKKLIATQGVKDLIIIDTEDTLLIMDKKEASNLKKMVKKLPAKVLD